MLAAIHSPEGVWWDSENESHTEQTAMGNVLPVEEDIDKILTMEPSSAIIIITPQPGPFL